MIKICASVLLLIFISTAYGLWLNKRIDFKLNGFVAPVGFALMMTLLQLSYYPAMLFNLSSNYEHAVSLLVMGTGLVYGLKNIKLIFIEYFSWKSTLILTSFGVFLAVFYLCYIDISFSDAQMYLNYMSENVNTEHVSMFNLWTGQKGAEWDTIYLFQGYYHFGAFLSWFVNVGYYCFGSTSFVDNITIQTWGLGMLYSLVSSMLLFNFADYLKINKLTKYLMIAFGMFYLNFFYWRVALSFYGNTFRTIYTCALLFYLYRYFKEERHDFKQICILIGFAGMSFSSSFLFICFSIMYAVMVYVFHTKKQGSIRDMADLVLPILCYALACFYKDSFGLFVVGIVFGGVYFSFRNVVAFDGVIQRIELFLNRYSYQIFVYGAAILMIVGGAAYYFFANPNYEYDYLHYFQNHSNYDMIKDYFFVHSGLVQNAVNVMRWTGVILLLISKSESKGIQFLKSLFLVLFVIFLNPLCVIAVSKLLASNVYYRTFDVVFNPFTEMMFLCLILERFTHRSMSRMMIGFVCFMVLYAHLGSFVSRNAGEYGFHINRGVLPKYKISNDNLDVIRVLQDEFEQNPDEDLRIISHAEGVRTFIPEAWQFFTAYQIYYPQTRIDQEFFEQARNHYPYETYGYINYYTVADKLQEYEVDYLIVEYNQNAEFNLQVEACCELLYKNYTYALYKTR